VGWPRRSTPPSSPGWPAADRAWTSGRGHVYSTLSTPRRASGRDRRRSGRVE
jgi:hypothetical protein